MEQTSSTRRRVLTAGVGVALGSVALAGCTGEAAPSDETEKSGTDPYEVSMAPVGTVEFESTVGAFMADHSAASELTAVQKGNVLRAGPIYPDQFSGDLFDRQELADIVTGGE